MRKFERNQTHTVYKGSYECFEKEITYLYLCLSQIDK